MTDRDLGHLHPALRPLCRAFLAECHQQQIACIVICTFRSAAEQDELYARGRTAPGKIVTNAKGGRSPHNVTLGGRPAACAFDFVIKRRDGTLNWNVNSGEWKAAVAIGKALGLVWGGDWSFKDYDHFELPDWKPTAAQSRQPSPR